MLNGNNRDSIVFSIIVPVYNAEKYLEKCIESVCNQTFPNYELILINDGSTDHSLEILNQYKEYDSIVIVNQENSGQTAARKKGLETSKGKYVLFLDSDDWLEIDTLNKCYKVINENPDIILFGYQQFKDGSKTDISIAYQEGLYKEDEIVKEFYSNLLMDEHGKFLPRALWGKVFKRDLVKKCIHTVPEIIRNGEDMCCVISTFLKANSVCVLDENLYCYRNDSVTSISRSKDPIALERVQVMARFLYDLIQDKDLMDQYWRLVLQQIYSATLRTYEAHGVTREFRNMFNNMANNDLCKQAIHNAKFSKSNKKLMIKQLILKYRLFWLMKLLRK